MNWAIPRQQVVEVAVAGLRAGWSTSVESACDLMLQLYYRGVSPTHARPQLVRDVTERYWQEHAGQSQAQARAADAFSAMFDTLQSEGWELIGNAQRGYLWRHVPTGALPNLNGGRWASIAEATMAVYNSATRQLLHGGDDGALG
jgi:hypothetical protein